MIDYQTRTIKSNFPLIDLGDYILREQTMNDLEDFYEYYSDPIVTKHIVSEIPRSLEEAKDELRYWINVFYSGSGIYFGIAKKDSNKLIGSIGITAINRTHNRAEISYDLAKEYWRFGIMSAALKAVTQHAFHNMKINRLEAYALKENIASRKLLLKSGFELEGELRQHRRHNGIYKDIGIFSFLNRA